MPQSHSVEIPTALLKKFICASEAFGELHEAFENYLTSANPLLHKKLRQARRQHRSGKTRPFSELKRDLNL